MSGLDRDPTARGDGSRTAGEGTPVAVDVSSDVRNRGVLAMFVAGPVIWTAHFLLVYLVVEAGCTGEGPALERFAPPVATAVTLVATAVAALGCLAVAAWNFRRWRAAQEDAEDGPGLEPPDRGGVLAMAGCAMALLGVVTVLFVGLPAVVLSTC